jgi:PPOX class probable F420-dependent enzyme
MCCHSASHIFASSALECRAWGLGATARLVIETDGRPSDGSLARSSAASGIATGQAAVNSVAMLTGRHLAFLRCCRVGHLATADCDGIPHLVPVCFAATGSTLYTPIDAKPKSGRELRRLKNIRENPRVSFLVDRYDEDWSRLGWLRIDGRAELLSEGQEFDRAALSLMGRYPQYRDMRLSCIIAIRIAGTRGWGDLEP